ncbi:retrovirus-related pol polyprotein from transposon TNT 1-94 [Tanacetum coccineum]
MMNKLEDDEDDEDDELAMKNNLPSDEISPPLALECSKCLPTAFCTSLERSAHPEMCLMASESQFKYDIADAEKLSRTEGWNSSMMYKVSNFKNYEMNEKDDMFAYLYDDLVTALKEQQKLKYEISKLKLTNDNLNCEKDQVLKELYAYQNQMEFLVNETKMVKPDLVLANENLKDRQAIIDLWLNPNKLAFESINHQMVIQRYRICVGAIRNAATISKFCPKVDDKIFEEINVNNVGKSEFFTPESQMSESTPEYDCPELNSHTHFPELSLEKTKTDNYLAENKMSRISIKVLPSVEIKQVSCCSSSKQVHQKIQTKEKKRNKLEVMEQTLGCSRHMTGCKFLLNKVLPADGPSVEFGGRKCGKTDGYGSLRKGQLSKNHLANGLPEINFHKNKTCHACEKGKQKPLTFKSVHSDQITASFHLLHMDLFGPIGTPSMSGKRYTLVIVDEFSRFTWVFFLKLKSETSHILINFIKLYELQFDTKIKQLRSDQGTEFRNATLEEFCSGKGIVQNFSAPYTPQQNGVAECRNRTLIEAARTMLSEANMKLYFWAEAVNTACYTQNRSIIVKRHNKTSYELLHLKKPSISHLKVFGCVCFILNSKDHPSKFAPKADEGILLGYSEISKAYRVYNSVRNTCNNVDFQKYDLQNFSLIKH